MSHQQRDVCDGLVKTLVKRFNKLTELKLCGTNINRDSLTYIIENLGETLLKLDVSDINFSRGHLLELIRMSKLKILIVGHTTHRFYNNFQEHNKDVVEYLKKQLSNVKILLGNPFQESLRIGNGQLGPKHGIWEIRERQIQSFSNAPGTR